MFQMSGGNNGNGALGAPPPGVQPHQAVPAPALGGGLHAPQLPPQQQQHQPFNVPQGGVGGQGVFGGALQPPAHGGGQQNALWHSQQAYQAAWYAEQQAKFATQRCDALSDAVVRNERWARDLKISQEKAKFRSAADRKGVAYLVEEGFDLKEMYDALNAITPANSTTPVVNATNANLVEKTFASLVTILQKRTRFRKYELESYSVARESSFGWSAEKLYKRDSVFLEEDYDSDKLWWQKPELSTEKKWERMRSADREAKFAAANSRKFDDARPPQQTRPSQFHPYARHDPRTCHSCGQTGHISRYCPVRRPFQTGGARSQFPQDSQFYQQQGGQQQQQYQGGQQQQQQYGQHPKK